MKWTFGINRRHLKQSDLMALFSAIFLLFIVMPILLYVSAVFVKRVFAKRLR